MLAALRKAAPEVDNVVADYASGYVQYLEDQASDPAKAQRLELDSEIEFLASVLRSAGANAAQVTELASKLNETLAPIYNKNVNRTVGNAAFRKLDKDTLLSAQKNNNVNMSLEDTRVDVNHLASNRKIDSRVDRKKLEKAERKIAAKIAKRERGFMQELEYEKSRLLDESSQQSYDDFFLTVNPLDLGPSEGKTKDIKIENFDLYVGNGKRILHDSTLTLSHKHRYGLVGKNGIGKSTLLKALSRRELNVPKHITILYVEQEVSGDDLSVLQTVLNADVWRKYLLNDQQRIQARLVKIQEEQALLAENDPVKAQLEQETDDLESNLNDIFEKLTAIESDRAEARASEILSGLGFSPASQAKATNTFSGGWRMRISLARALFCKPDLLMLDEPSNMLDIPSITFLSDYLLTYPGTLFVVSHDRAFLNDVATDIIHQHSERLDYYRGCDFDSFNATKEERYKNARREYDNQMAYRKHLQTFIDKFRYNAGKAAEAQSRIKKLEKLPILEEPQKDTEISFKFPDPDPLSPPILQLQSVKFGYTQDTLLLDDVDLSVDMDSRIALVGGNGCGKTTLLKLILGKLTPQSGMVSTNQRLRIGYFAQHHVDGMDLSLNPVEWMAKVKPGKSDEEYRRLLGAFGITGTLGLQKLALLSGGQKSRVAFACLGLSNPHILVLDEPSNHLDIAGLDALADALNSFKGGILMVSHDVTIIKRICNQVWVSANGKVQQFPAGIDEYKRHILKQASGAGVVAKH